jgi:hypothetical protein
MLSGTRIFSTSASLTASSVVRRAQNKQPAKLLTNAAACLAQSRLLLRRAIPNLEPGDAVELGRLGDSLHAVIRLLEIKSRRVA